MNECSDCNLGLVAFYSRFYKHPTELVELAQRHNLILTDKICERCGLQARRDIKLNKWRCNRYVSINKQKRRKCNWSQTIFRNTFLEGVHLPIEKVLMFLNIYIRECFSYQFTSELCFSPTTINHWSSFCREVLIEWCVKHSELIIGGPGHIVEIYDSKLEKRKCNVGYLVETQLVCGGICRESEKFFMVPITDQTSATLVSVIKEKVAPGTTIISDCCWAHYCLHDEGFEQLAVNHSINFMDPQSLSHTNSIVGLYDSSERKVLLHGRNRKHFAGFLARSMFMIHFKDPNTRFHPFLEAVALLYNPNNALTAIQHQTNKIKPGTIGEDSVSEPDYFGNFNEKFVTVKAGLDEFSDGEVIIKEEMEDSLDDDEDFSDNESGSMAHRNWQDWSRITEDLSDDSDSDSNNRQCTGCLSTFEKLVFDLQKSDEKALEVFASHGIIPRVRTCPRCANLCVFKPSERLFYCDQKVTVPGSVGEYMCSYSVSQDHDTWLFHFKHNPNIVLRFINLFLQSFFSFKYCAVNYKLSKGTFDKWQRLCLEVCTHWLNNQEPIGGPGIQVEIDDCKFIRSHCDKKDAVVWIFGGIERRSQKKFVVEVQTESREALIPLIQKYVKPQTVVFSDSQEPYTSISELPQNYTHIKTDPSIKSSDSIDRNIHIKNIVNLLNSIKSRILKSGCKKYNFRHFFQRFMFLASHQNDQTILHDFLMAIAAMYPPPKQV